MFVLPIKQTCSEFRITYHNSAFILHLPAPIVLDGEGADFLAALAPFLKDALLAACLTDGTFVTVIDTGCELVVLTLES